MLIITAVQLDENYLERVPLKHGKRLQGLSFKKWQQVCIKINFMLMLSLIIVSPFSQTCQAGDYCSYNLLRQLCYTKLENFLQIYTQNVNTSDDLACI